MKTHSEITKANIMHCLKELESLDDFPMMVIISVVEDERGEPDVAVQTNLYPAMFKALLSDIADQT